jgi:2-methylisocitrate lyase-like PEP mutase family enzyme
MGEIVEAGGRRISVGGALAFAAVDAMAAAAERMRDTGDFSALGSQVRIREWFGE